MVLLDVVQLVVTPRPAEHVEHVLQTLWSSLLLYELPVSQSSHMVSLYIEQIETAPRLTGHVEHILQDD
jgi:hypothetical protein